MQKRIMLACGGIERNYWQISCLIKSNGAFHGKGDLALRNKEELKANAEQYRKTEKGRLERLKNTTDWLKTEKGKQCHLRQIHKRRRNLGFIPLTPPMNVPFIWHHIDKDHVIAVIKQWHCQTSHKCGDLRLEGVLG